MYDFESFQMETFLSKGCEIEVWSAVNWKIPGVNMPQNADVSGRTHYIDSAESLAEELARVKSEKCIFLVYPYHDYEYIAYYIRKSIKEAGFDFCNITESPPTQPMFKAVYSYSKGMICLIELYLTLRRIVKSFIKNPILKLCHKKDGNKDVNIIIGIKNLYARIWGPLRYKSLYNFVTVELLYDSFPNYFEIFSKRNILIHSESYDEYLDSKDALSLYDKEYVVYIDGYEIGHSDYIKCGGRFPVSDPQRHLSRLNTLFDEIEQTCGCKVIIAAHPKAEYRGDEFCGRDIVYYKTNNLIKDAKLVIMGTSTCIGTVMLYKKDYLIIYSSEYFINVPRKEKGYNAVTQWLGCRKLDIQDKSEIKNWMEYVKEYSEDIGKKYRKRFIISDNGILDKKIYEVISDMILK